MAVSAGVCRGKNSPLKMVGKGEKKREREGERGERKIMIIQKASGEKKKVKKGKTSNRKR